MRVVREASTYPKPMRTSNSMMGSFLLEPNQLQLGSYQFTNVVPFCEQR